MQLAKKLCLLGDFSVGKTSLIRRYVLNEFSLDYRATVGVQIHQHSDEIEIAGRTVQFAQVIWDVEGSHHGEQLVTNYVLGAAGALIIGDGTRDDAIPSMLSHAEQFQRILPGRPVVFALNKSDLVAPERRQDGQELVDAFGGEVVDTSALTGDAVAFLFRALGRRIIELGI
jgi:small GTP-binding protein